MITITSNNLSLDSLLSISTGPFARPAWFNSPDCINGRSAAWHSKYSRNHTLVFGPIACRATARITGSGGAERGWSDNKEVKRGKRSHLRSDKLRKQAHSTFQPTFVEHASRGMSWRDRIVKLLMPSGEMTMSNLIWDLRSGV